MRRIKPVSPWTIRSTAVVVIFLSLFIITGGVEGILYSNTNIYEEQSQLAAGDRTSVAGERDTATVLTFSGNGPMVLLNANGSVAYYTSAYDSFWDVDPIPGTQRSVIVVASDEYDVDECPGSGACTRNYVLRWNLSTGERSVLIDRFRPKLRGSEWHDVDAIDPDEDGDKVIIAGIEQSRIMRINTTTGLSEWSYSFQADYPLESGGSYPGGSWTHLNDVEVTSNGRIMASPRNHDSVIFIDGTGELNESLTLGSDNTHEILNEQHNPDYIPVSEGGPAILIADSQNDRVIEYQREDGDWVESWVWSNGQMKWPRDVDRLPNGHTLITDTNANRFIEVDTDGEIVWSHSSPPGLNPYEAERLGTGDESRGGPSAAEANLKSNRAQGATTRNTNSIDHPWRKIWTTAKSILPNKIVNGILLVKPPWLTSADIPLMIVDMLTILVWAGYEIRRLNRSVTVRSPIQITGKSD